MGFDNSTYHFYGLHVPSELWTEYTASQEGEKTDAVIRALREHMPNVAWLSAGDYDRDHLFLVIDQPGVSSEVRLGTFRLVTGDQLTNCNWDKQLRYLADAMGYGSANVGQPGWIICPDVS